jgi:hypothetical protein
VQYTLRKVSLKQVYRCKLIFSGDFALKFFLYIYAKSVVTIRDCIGLKTCDFEIKLLVGQNRCVPMTQLHCFKTFSSVLFSNFCFRCNGAIELLLKTFTLRFEATTSDRNPSNLGDEAIQKQTALFFDTASPEKRNEGLKRQKT